MLVEDKGSLEWIVEERDDGYQLLASKSAAAKGTKAGCIDRGRGQPSL